MTQPTNEDLIKIDPILSYFGYEHLPLGPLRETSRDFNHLAFDLVRRLPRSPERTVALRKLLESKDAAVRTALELIKPAT